MQTTLGTRPEKQNHSALVEKYSSFLGKSKGGGTPSSGDVSYPNHQVQHTS